MNRIKKIDILKLIGLACIILAHVEPNKVVFQLRNFDVVLMIMVSSFLFINKYKENTNITLEYLKKRIMRLVVPTWIFLVIFFGIYFFIEPFGLKTIISSFILHEGIGYVWIVRIYILVAIILPFLVPKLKNKKTYYIEVMLYIVYEILAKFNLFSYNIILSDIVAYIIPLAIIITITYWIMNSNNKKVLLFSFVNFIIYIICLLIIYKLTGEYKDTNYMKYPFRIYYLSYAFFVSAILIVLSRNQNIVNFLYNKVVEFISKSSLWIYLWHILFIKLLTNIKMFWTIKYIVVFSLAIIITYFQNEILNYLQKKGVNNGILNLFRG